VYAIFYVGFDNILTGLTAELQHALEHCADVLGNFVQKAALREQLETLKVLDLRHDNNYLPANRLMAGRSNKLSETYKYIARLSPVDIPVLITGETGTGKELVAQELHRGGGRSSGPFIVINAAALPENLIESELFGHKKGSFTGAFADKTGLIEKSENGTLFIDEIGELPFSLQAKLLRVLQERSVTRIGESIQRPVNFRLITATHRNLEEMVGNGTFREDLFYRIAGANLKTWPLRERTEDITVLANFFRKQFFDQNAIPSKEFSSDAQVALESYAWPGNIRELQNIVSRACIMAEGIVIKRDDLALDPKLMTNADARMFGEQKLDSLEAAKDDWMKKYITDALRIHGGKRGETAKALGIGERTLFRYLDQLHINDKSL
jgi:DNA-binding NtrC family response regulator